MDIEYYRDDNGIKKLCKCGCGQPIEIKLEHKYHGHDIPEYINHHYTKTEEYKLRKKKEWQDPNSKYNSKEYREKIRKKMKNRIFTIEHRRRLSKSLMGNTNQNLEKMQKGFQIWQKENPEEYIENQRKAGANGGAALLKLIQTTNGFVSKPEAIMKSLLPPDFLHNIKFHNFVPDFRSEKRKIVIEVDGIYWHSLPEAISTDKRKDIFFMAKGYVVYRFTDIQIVNDLDGVKKRLEGIILEDCIDYGSE